MRSTQSGGKGWSDDAAAVQQWITGLETATVLRVFLETTEDGFEELSQQLPDNRKLLTEELWPPLLETAMRRGLYVTAKAPPAETGK